MTENYSYDAIYQLTQVLQGATTTESYTYDTVGNRLSSLTSSLNQYNNSNELTSDATFTYQYDHNGNLTSKSDSNGNTTAYAWDFENHLTSVTLPNNGGVVTYAYDPFGRRIRRVGLSSATIYAYDGPDLASDDANAVAEYDTSGNVVATYTQGEGLDEPLAMSRSGATSFYHADGLGSITSMTDGTGSAVAAYVTDSFGKSTQSAGTVTNPFRYTAREWDSDTNLYYYRARFYDVASGRFASEDPTGFSDGVNFYRYVRNGPANNTDPYGLTTYQGFPADREVQMRNAVDEAIRKLREKCPSCAGKDGPTLINIIQSATFVFQPNSKYCGVTGPLSFLGVRHRFGIGLPAFGSLCCSLESTIVHEASHGMRHWSDKRPEQVEKDCFGCSIPGAQ